MAKKITGYLIEPHSEKCFYFGPNSARDRSPWCLPESGYVTPIGHKSRKSLFVFRCNCSQCPAKMGISSHVFHRVWNELLGHLKEKGAPKKRKQRGNSREAGRGNG